MDLQTLSHAKVSGALETWLCLRSFKSKVNINQLNGPISKLQPRLSIFDRKLIKGSMHNFHEIGLRSHTSYVHISQSVDVDKWPRMYDPKAKT